MVNTSTHEGFPNTFIQAWMREVAVVSLDVDPDRILATEHAGIVAHSEDALTAAVSTLIDHPEVRAGLVKRGREYAGTHHALKNAEALVQLIRSSCGEALI